MVVMVAQSCECTRYHRSIKCLQKWYVSQISPVKISRKRKERKKRYKKKGKGGKRKSSWCRRKPVAKMENQGWKQEKYSSRNRKNRSQQFQMLQSVQVKQEQREVHGLWKMQEIWKLWVILVKAVASVWRGRSHVSANEGVNWASRKYRQDAKLSFIKFWGGSMELKEVLSLLCF